MNWFRPRPKIDNRLLGGWTIDPMDMAAVGEFGDVEMEFDGAGNLNYLIKSEDTIQAVFMTYSVEGNMLVTDQPSHPQPERTFYAISEDGVLTLAFGGVASRFLRRSP